MMVDLSMRKLAATALVLLFLAPALGAAKQDRTPTPKLSALKESADFLGPGWNGPRGLVIDDFNDLSSLKEIEKPVAADVVKQLKPAGVVAAADYSYQKALEMVTLRVFAFENSATAEAFWKAKYENDGWEKLYKKADLPGVRAVDSLQISKRIILTGNVLLSGLHAPAGTSHVAALNKYLDKIRAGQK